jgi:hypothetical protein
MRARYLKTYSYRPCTHGFCRPVKFSRSIRRVAGPKSSTSICLALSLAEDGDRPHYRGAVPTRRRRASVKQPMASFENVIGNRGHRRAASPHAPRGLDSRLTPHGVRLLQTRYFPGCPAPLSGHAGAILGQCRRQVCATEAPLIRPSSREDGRTPARSSCPLRQGPLYLGFCREGSLSYGEAV